MDVVADVLEKTAKDAENYKTITVEKHLDVEYDLGTLLAMDTNDLDQKLLRKQTNDYLLQLTRDNVQLLMNQIWELPTERIEEAIVVRLPPPTFSLPRSKRVPKPKPLTKWQQFAKDKGIQKKKKSKLKWDEQLQKWIPLFGYKRAAAQRDKDWVLEVPQNADPYEDQFAKRADAKGERVAKNELQRLRNIAKARKVKIPRVGLLNSDVAGSKELQTAVTVARSSTASVGKFQERLPKEKEARGVADITPGANRKRKAPPPVSAKQEKSEYLGLLDTAVLNKKPKVDVDKAVSRQINQEQTARSEEKRTHKSVPKRSKQRSSAKGPQSGRVGKKPRAGKGTRKGTGGSGRKRR